MYVVNEYTLMLKLMFQSEASKYIQPNVVFSHITDITSINKQMQFIHSFICHIFIFYIHD
jgi:hypothetical protein